MNSSCYTGDLKITAYNNSMSNVFVKEVKLNGNSVDLKHSPFIKHFGKYHSN